MERKRLLILVLLLATLVALLPGCGKKGDDTFRLGISLPLTGEMAYTGQGMKKTYDLIIADTNAKGGFLAGPDRPEILKKMCLSCHNGRWDHSFSNFLNSYSSYKNATPTESTSAAVAGK